MAITLNETIFLSKQGQALGLMTLIKTNEKLPTQTRILDQLFKLTFPLKNLRKISPAME